jgi:hypothetical protein
MAPVTSTRTRKPSNRFGMRRFVSGLESASSTVMQRSPPHNPMAVPTTPGSAIRESVCAASTSSMLRVGKADPPSPLPRELEQANAAPAASSSTNRLTVKTA